MTKGRIEAFSDGVFAIIITIMVLELRIPHADSIQSVLRIWPSLLSYLLSFIFVGIYWNNHHHLFQAVKNIDGRVLWANLSLLFWLSFLPVVTGWMGENHFSSVPVALYGVVLLCAGTAYFILTRVLLLLHGKESVLAVALGNDVKGKISLVFYMAGTPLALVAPLPAYGIYIIVAIIWLIPDKRIEKTLNS
jgi:uncharacterized membrane protein